jgi:cell division protein FtsI/penicillin-binding protein 2
MPRGRTLFLRVAVLAVFLVLVGRLGWLVGVKGEDITQRAEALRLERKKIEPIRGAMLDRAGRHLAVSVPTYTVVADTIQMKDPRAQQKVAQGLAPLIGLDAEAILKKLRANPNSGWVPLKGGLGLEQVQKIQALRLDGIYFERQQQRVYPQGMAANHVIGYLNAEKRGEYGLEARYDEELRGKEGEILAEFTLGQTPIENTIKEQVPERPGRNLVLTLDASLQQRAEAKLDEVMKQYEAKRALVLAMDVHTGEILVMAMRPGADPGRRETWGDPVDFNRITNWAISHPMSPGSIFKTITIAAALEEGAITPESTFVDEGTIVLSGSRIRNWDGYGSTKPETIAELMQRSSNVGLVKIGQKLGNQNFVKYLKAFGFMEPTGVDFSADSAGNFGSPFEQKQDIDWGNMFIGQHLEVTPLQMIRAVAAIANGGKLVTPHLVKEIREGEDKVVWTAPTEPVRQVISAKTANEVKEIMVSVVEKGTARTALLDRYTVAGKTGTAQKFENGRLKDRYLADFIGFAPASNPQVAMLVMVDEPKGVGYGGLVAAPIFKELMPLVLEALQIPPDRPVKEQPQPTAVAGQVPDLQWLPVSVVRERLNEAGLEPRFTGKGDVVAAQSIAPGTSVRPGAVIDLTLVPKNPADGLVHMPNFTGLSLAEAGRLAAEFDLVLKAGGSGFVVGQDVRPGTVVSVRSGVGVRLAPRP